jgi:hypothetical protein
MQELQISQRTNNLFLQIHVITIKRKQVQEFIFSIKLILSAVLALYLVQNKASFALYFPFIYMFHRIQFFTFYETYDVFIKGLAESICDLG